MLANGHPPLVLAMLREKKQLVMVRLLPGPTSTAPAGPLLAVLPACAEVQQCEAPLPTQGCQQHAGVVLSVTCEVAVVYTDVVCHKVGTPS